MKFSVCVEAVFHSLDFAQGMRKTKECGYSAFEFWSWWDKDIGKISALSRDLGLETAALCTRFISLADATQRSQYLKGLNETVNVARMLGCKTVISQVGNEIPGVPRQAQHDSIVQGLSSCIPLLRDAGVTLVFEPLNTIVNHAGHYLWSSSEAFDIEREVGSEFVKVLFDIYHQQIMEGNLINNIVSNINGIGHFHCAGNPGRHELSLGEINYTEVFKSVRCTPYQGFIGLEYFPMSDPTEGLLRLAEQQAYR